MRRRRARRCAMAPRPQGSTVKNRKAGSRVRVGVTSHPSHRSGRAQLRHPVRPAMGSRSRFCIRGTCGDPPPRSKALDGFPPHGSLTGIPLPSPGSLRFRFPCFHGTMKMCDSLGPSHRASLPSLGDTRRCVGAFAPSGPERPTAGQGFVIRSPPPDSFRLETLRVSQGSWGIPLCLCPVL